MRILLFGRYDSEYSRNRVMIKGLKAAKYDILECRTSATGWTWPFRLIFSYLKQRPKFDIMFVAFPGQETMFIARLLTRKPIVFDAFTSHYGGYILDRERYPTTSWHAKYYRFLDTWSCKLANTVLLDTFAHINFFVKTFDLPRNKFIRILVGTDSDVFKPGDETRSDSQKFLVHFHGNFIPLQGVRYIIDAAKILENENIVFNIIGRGATYDDDISYAKKINVKNISFYDRVPYDVLPSFIAKADVTLGIFGISPKTDLVISNKIYEAMAMRKPIITGETEAAKELFIDGENIIFCKTGDGRDLADKIMLLRNDKMLRDKIAENAYELYNVECNEGRILEELVLKLTNRT